MTALAEAGGRAAPGAGLIVSVAGLAVALREAAPPAVLDVRWRLGGPPGRDSYRAGHIPGAVFTDLDRDLAGPPGGPGGRHPLPAAADFQAAMRRAGISPGRPVVVYDETDATSAARAWWLLRYFGHGPVRVLDGGYRAWTAAGQPSSTEEPSPEPGTFTAVPGGLPLLDAAAAARLARSGLLLDARAGERYRGEHEPADPVAGHIPGAVSAPAAGNVAGDGRFLSAAALRARFARLGVPGLAAPAAIGETARGAGAGTVARAGVHTGAVPAGSPGGGVGAYCGSGVTAAHEVLALALAGVPAALYADSWSGWITGPERPVAVGPEPG